jgi:hypothetical protein
MPSTYSPDLRIELIANGEQSGTWGTTTNNNLGTIIEDAISGMVQIVTSGQKYALTAANGAVDEARCAILVLDTTYSPSPPNPAAKYEVYAPPVTKLYVVKNASTIRDLDLYCATTINGTTAAGAAYTIPKGKTAFVRSSGTAFFDATDYVAGSVTFTNAELITPSLSGETFSTAATVAAGGNSQGSLALTADYNVITTAATSPASGVTLPSATVGRRIIIVNRGANPVNVYPASGDAIDSQSTNISIPLPVNGSLEFNAATVDRWYSNTTLSLNDAVTTAVRVATLTGISAAGTVQGDSTLLTADYNIVGTTPSGTGVRLPVATVGRRVTIVNRGANTLRIYVNASPVGTVIDTSSAFISLPANNVVDLIAASTTQWFSSFNLYVSSSAGGVSFTGTVPVAAGQLAVYSSTTGNSITTSNTYDLRAPAGGGNPQPQLRLFEDPDSAGGTEYTAIQANSNVTASYVLTLPAAVGSANQYLAINGTPSGTPLVANLAWTSPTSGSGTVTSVAKGNGMDFTTFTTSGTITLGAPSPITSTSTDAVTASSHTHSITGAAFLAGAQTFSGKKTFTGGVTSLSLNFTDDGSDESIYGGTNQVITATDNNARFVVENGSAKPFSDGLLSLGTSSIKWGQIYSTSGTINTSDANYKQDIADLDDAEKRVAVRIKGLIKKFRFKDAVATKGNEARIHVGVIAQEVRDAFVAEGLDAHRYGLFCSDTWWEREEEELYPPSGEMRLVTKIYETPVEGAVEKTRLSMRYDELLAFVVAAI